MSQSHPRILYLVGYGRSGSTLLELLLNRYQQVTGIGEAKYYFERGLLSGEPCACGSVARHCEFWSTAVRATDQNGGEDYARAAAALAARFESTKRFPLHWLARRWLTRSGDFLAYQASLRHLYRAVAERASPDLILDGSKMPARLYWLASLGDYDVMAIHIVRDGRGVAWSSGKLLKRKEATKTSASSQYMPRFGYWSALARWALNGYISLLVLKVARTPYIRVRYEDLVRQPEETVAQILDWLGISEAKEVPGKPHHSISGHPMRHSGKPVVVTPDAEWRANVPPVRRTLGYLLNLPLNVYYRYNP